MDIAKIARIYLAGGQMPEPSSDPATIDSEIRLTRRIMTNAESRREHRSANVAFNWVAYDGSKVEASTKGQLSDYRTKIQFRPRPSYNCTCTDLSQQRGAVGPCKHVIALASKWEDTLVAQLEHM